MAEGRNTEVQTVISNVVPMTTKITEHKLNNSNYLNWSKTVRVYLRSIDKDDHLVDDPPSDAAAKKAWLRDDARIFLQIRNSIDTEVIGLVNHCEFVKNLLDYLAFLYSGKGNISRIYDVCKEFYHPEKQDRPLTEYFMDFKRVYEELNSLLPFSTDVKTQQSQREQMAVMSFLAEGSRSAPIITSALVSRGTSNEAGRGSHDSRGSRRNTGFQGSWSGGGLGRNTGHNKLVCYYCDEPCHTRRTCWKLNGKPQQQAQVANIATQGINHVSAMSSSNDKSVLVSVDEFACFTQYQASLKSNPSTIDDSLITQVYSRRPPPDNSCPPLAPTSIDPSLDLPIAVRKDSVSVPKTLVEALSHPGVSDRLEEMGWSVTTMSGEEMGWSVTTMSGEEIKGVCITGSSLFVPVE
ncbi:hypothetical protein DKX38_017504 [Salix brachista]|uniref:Retrotransposon Copia-like N-terminal domain-containing protein n=1 Tax=Salix brachista TaxID=2182728 RepID=A0A5N5KWB0_9ROSI|nr:hypothetical protein DKX38_017504 [Salix brachista]